MPSDSSGARRGGLDRKGGGGVLRDRVGWEEGVRVYDEGGVG